MAFAPTAYAVGYYLSPLTGLTVKPGAAGLFHPVTSSPRHSVT